MSTPSTATATHPSHHPHYGYSHHPLAYQTSSAYPASTAAGSARLANNYAFSANTPTATTTTTTTTEAHPLPPVPPQTAPAPANSVSALPNTANSASMSSGTSSRRRKPDWKEFYKNGLPKEIIIIDDTPPPDQAAGARSTAAAAVNGQPAGKKRRTGLQSAYDVTYHDRPSFSTNPQPYWENSSHNSLSTDRTTSLHTTAPTSLGSAGSVGTNNGVHYEDANIGQKRKRNTRTSTRQEAKRRELEAVSDAFLSYIPPPQPPIKAKDVPVPVIRDYSYSRHEKVDDEDGHYIVQAETPLTDRLQKYRDASKIELRVLSTLASNDKTNRNKCIHLRDCFDFRNHICIVTDLLGQILHDLNLIHTDLKPENILLVSNNYQTFTYNRTIPSSSHTTSRNARHRRVLLDSEIRLIDFGSATFDDEYHSSVVSTRHYRAPEIILNLGWSFPCDIWSIGCILVEFFTGDALFQTHDNLEHLAMMESVIGSRIDSKMVKQVMQGRGNSQNQAAKYFNRNKLDYPNEETTRPSRKYVRAMKQLHEFIPQNHAFNKQFLDLLQKIFVYDPKQRLTAKQALKHPWFKETIVDDGTEAVRLAKLHSRLL
ncbi:hypothetical protein UA08_08737 [Talaromyces atroroseus]|uniref:Protein kinase domain-containing protein n=1 Tax=Talaromyces atroroseus TaxID=1441469 RepID=A0A225AKI9_TALAT|nr:hypothetical protein UA08_08737 [Talaromyces atroroseus]OKL56049.1 hypothetical protein UA08_08737 [Talaromyces atroroseus]